MYVGFGIQYWVCNIFKKMYLSYTNRKSVSKNSQASMRETAKIRKVSKIRFMLETQFSTPSFDQKKIFVSRLLEVLHNVELLVRCFYGCFQLSTGPCQ